MCIGLATCSRPGVSGTAGTNDSTLKYSGGASGTYKIHLDLGTAVDLQVIIGNYSTLRHSGRAELEDGFCFYLKVRVIE